MNVLFGEVGDCQLFFGLNDNKAISRRRDCMSGARHLKLGGNEEAKTRTQGQYFFSVWAKCRPLFRCCVYRKDVARSRGRVGRDQGTKLPEAETLLAFGHAIEVANLPAI